MPDGGVMGATTYIDGRPAAIEYLRPDFGPGTPTDHTMVHVRFLDDNSSLIAQRDDDPPALDALARSILSDRAAAARRRLVMDAEWNEGAHPRGQPDNKGQFAKKGEAIAGAAPEAPAAPKAKKAKAPKVAKPKTKKVAPTAAPTPSSAPSTPPPVSTGKEPPPFPGVQLKPPAGFVVEYDGHTIKSYKDLAGHVLNLLDNGEWTLFPDDHPSDAGPVAKGTTQQDLEAAISKHFGSAPAAAPKSAPPTDHPTFSFNTPETQAALNKMPPEAQANATALSWAGYTAHPHNLGIDFVKGNSHQIELYSDGSFSIDDKDGQPLDHGDKADELPAKLNSILDEFFALEEKPQFKGGAVTASAASHGPKPFSKVLAPPALFGASYQHDEHSAYYKGPNGHTLIIGQSGGWGIYKGKDNDEQVAGGFLDQEELDAAAAKLSGSPASSSAPAAIEHGPAAFGGAVAPPAAFGKPTEMGAAAWTYEDANGNVLDISPSGWWTIVAKKGKGKFLANGSTQEELDATVAKLAQPLTLPSHIKPTSTQKGDKGETVYNFSDGGMLSIKPDSTWGYFSPNGTAKMGAGQEGLNALFEQLHPRGKGGKFVKKNAKGEFELSGLTPDGDEPSQFNTAWGMGDAGHRFWWGGNDGEKLQASVIIGTGENANKWRVFSRSGGSVQGEGLDGLIAAIQNTAEIPKPGAGGAGAGGAEPSTLAHGEAPYGGSLAPPTDWDAPYAKSGIAWSYQSGGSYLDIYHDGSWALMPDGKPIVSGKGQADLDAAILQHVPESIVQGATPAVSVPDAVLHGEAPFGNVKAPSVFGPFNEKDDLSAEYKIADDEPGLHLANNGNWAIFDGDGTQVASGNGQASLDSATLEYVPQASAPEYLVSSQTNAPSAAPVTPITPSPSVGSIGAPITLSGLTKLGGAKGGNPGGTYQDKDGKKYYVKLLQDEDHVRNEMLAAKLYQLTGAPTLDYHPVGDTPNAISTDWQELDHDNLADLTPAQRQQAKLDFAAHAWLASWDAVGKTGDNIGATKAGGHINLDVGGTLAYRALGEPKGAKFGVTVPEWETLRDPGVNANSAALFGDMTTDQLAQSVKQVADISLDKINDAIVAAGYDPDEADQLYKKLVARRVDLIQRAKTEIANKQLAKAVAAQSIDQSAPPPGETWATPKRTDFNTWDNDYHARLKAAPRATKKEQNALSIYTGGDYRPWNKALRDSQGRDAGQFQQYTPILDKWLDRASYPKDEVLTRIVNTNFAKYLLGEYRSSQQPGAQQFGPYQFNDDGFISSDTWSGPLVMKIKIPKGAKAAAVGYHSESPNENEVLIARGSRFQIDDVDANGVMHMTLVRSGRAENGVWHPIKSAAPVAAMPVTPKATATDHLTFAKGSPLPVATLHGKKFESWKPPAEWKNVTGTNSGVSMPPLPDTTKKRSSGIVMLEPDGRVWLVKPTNGFGGYNYTFPKGGVEPGLDTRANAIKETYEESGLKGNITGFVGDYEGDTSLTRYFLGERETGTPLDHGPESESVVLVPLAEAAQYLNQERDLKILADVIASQAAAPLKQAA